MASPIRVTVSRTAASKARAQKRKANQARAKAKRAQQQAQGQRGRAQQRAQGQAQRQRAAKIAKAAGRAGARAAVPRPITAAVRAGRAAGMDGIEEVAIGGMGVFNDYSGALMAINPAQRRRARQQAGLGAATTASARAKAAAAAPRQAAIRDRSQARAESTDVAELRSQVGRKRAQLDRQHKASQATVDRLDDDLNAGRIPRDKAPQAAAARRKAGAESTALFFRRQRAQVASDFLDEARKAPTARQREALKQGAAAVLNAPMKAENGSISVPCDPSGARRRGGRRGGSRGGSRGGRPVAQMGGFEEIAVGGLGLPGGAYTGSDFVPQGPSGYFPGSPAVGIRRAITAAGMPSAYQPPANIQVPNFAPLPPGIAAAQPNMPRFYGGVGMRTSMVRPNTLAVGIPRIPPSGAPIIRVPASAQHPMNHRPRLPGGGGMPARLAARIAGRVVKAGAPGGAFVAPAAGVPETDGPRGGVVEVDSPTATDATVTEADMGWLGIDGMVGDLAGAFDSFVLSAELDNFDLGDMNGVRDRASRFKTRLRANKLRGAADADSALVATGMATALATGAFPTTVGTAGMTAGALLPGILAATGPLAPFALAAIARRVMTKRADKQVSRESRLASSVGQQVTPRKRRGRRGAVLRRMRAQGAARSGCS